MNEELSIDHLISKIQQLESQNKELRRIQEQERLFFPLFVRVIKFHFKKRRSVCVCVCTLVLKIL
jgi:hypothetical protein